MIGYFKLYSVAYSSGSASEEEKHNAIVMDIFHSRHFDLCSKKSTGGTMALFYSVSTNIINAIYCAVAAVTCQNVCCETIFLLSDLLLHNTALITY